MQDFLITSVIASIILTLAINVLPMVFPKSAEKAERKLHEKINQTIEQEIQGPQPRVRVFFPWKIMLIGSIVLTVLVNVVGWVSSR